MSEMNSNRIRDNAFIFDENPAVQNPKHIKNVLGFNQTIRI